MVTLCDGTRRLLAHRKPKSASSYQLRDRVGVPASGGSATSYSLDEEETKRVLAWTLQAAEIITELPGLQGLNQSMEVQSALRDRFLADFRLKPAGSQQLNLSDLLQIMQLSLRRHDGVIGHTWNQWLQQRWTHLVEPSMVCNLV